MDEAINKYIHYFTGEVYGFGIEDSEGEPFYSASGFFGEDFEINGLNDLVMNQIGWAM